MSEPIQQNKNGLGAKALAIAGWIGGAAVGKYSGISLLIPALATGGIWWSAKRILRAEKQPIVPALSVNTGHFLWLLLGFVITGDPNITGDLFVYAIGLLWLIKKPLTGPLYLLGGYQAFSLVVNSVAFIDAAVGSAAHKALLVHIVWRVWALVLIVKLHLAIRQNVPQEDVAAS